MTEYNLFCHSEQYNDNNSFQQQRWRVFNVLVSEQEWLDLEERIMTILGQPEKNWRDVTDNQWRRLMQIAIEVRGDDFREGFEFISGQKLPSLEPERMVTVGGKEYSEATIQRALREYVGKDTPCK